MTITISHSLIENKNISALAFYIYILVKAGCGKLTNSYQTILNRLVEDCGYIPNMHKGKSNDKVLQAFRQLIENKMITVEQDIFNLKPNDLLDIEIEENSYDKADRYAVLSSEAWQLIKSMQCKNKALAVRIYLFICASMYDIRSGLQICSLTTNQIINMIGTISENTVLTTIEELVSARLIFKWQVIFENNNRDMRRNFYALDSFDEQMIKVCQTIATNYGKYKLTEKKD